MFERRRLEDDDGQAVDDHVAADLRERLGEPEQQERAVAEDLEGATLAPRRRCRRSARRWRRAAGTSRAAGRDGGAEGRVTALARTRRSGARGRAARSARGGRRSCTGGRCRRPGGRCSQVSPPHGWRRRSRTTSPSSSGSTGWPDIARQGSRGWPRPDSPGLGGPAVRAAVGRGRGRGRASVAGTSTRSSALTVMIGVGEAGGELRDRAAGPGQRPRQGLRLADRHELDRIAGSGASPISTSPAGPFGTSPATIRVPPIAIASAPALRSSLSSCSRASPGRSPGRPSPGSPRP